jgi:hypothetical protein
LSTILSAPEASSSPRKSGSLLKFFVASLQAALECRQLIDFHALMAAGSARKSASPFFMSLRSNPLDGYRRAELFCTCGRQLAAQVARCLNFMSPRSKPLEIHPWVRFLCAPVLAGSARKSALPAYVK